MKHLESFNSRIKKGKTPPYVIEVKYEHGDADLDTKDSFACKDEAEFRRKLEFLFECMNFVPNTAYGNLGYFYPIPADANNGRSNEEKVWKKCCDIGEKYGLNEDEVSEFIKSDNHYRNGFADIEGVRIVINGQNKVIVYKKALETNKVSLPNIGDIIEVDCNEINGYGKEIWGGSHYDYLPNSGPGKDFNCRKFKAKVIDCSIGFDNDYKNEYFNSYEYFKYVILSEALEPVSNSGKDVRKVTTEMDGWDKDFESKFNKDKYDGLNYYEL